MKKKLFLLIMAAFSLAVVPSCDKEDEPDGGLVEDVDDNKDQSGDKNENDESTFDLLAGKYSGALILGLTNEEIANPLYVNVATKDGNKINLSLDPITILNMEINDLNFEDIPVNSKQETWIFSLDSKATIQGTEIPVSVEGTFDPKSKKDQLVFTVKVSQDGMLIPLNYNGNKQ